eukprot:UN11869
MMCCFLLLTTGHSRIPILKKTDFGNNLHLVGVLYAKDLVLLDPDDEISVLHIMNAFKYKKPIFLSANTHLDQCLKIFVHSRQHLCMVKDDTANDNSAVERKMSHFDEYLQKQQQNSVPIGNEVSIGIITLEDVIEHALQTELVDEHDVFINMRSQLKTNRLSRIDWSILQMFDHRQKILTNLPPQELQAVYHFFSHSIRSFMPQHSKCSESSIKNLLISSSVRKVDVNNHS